MFDYLFDLIDYVWVFYYISIGRPPGPGWVDWSVLLLPGGLWEVSLLGNMKIDSNISTMARRRITLATQTCQIGVHTTVLLNPTIIASVNSLRFHGQFNQQ